MSIGISDYVELEAAELHDETVREFGLGELAVTDGGDIVEIAAHHDPDSYDAYDGDELVVVSVLALRPATRGAFVVVTMDGDGDEVPHYFHTIDQAHAFAQVSDDEVVDFAGLMD
jgi:hypothetical protein